AAAALAECFDDARSDTDRLAAAQRALFAPGNSVDPSFLDPGRTVVAARAQSFTPRLVVQGLDDRIAPPENGYRLRERWPDRVEVVDVPDAGHAILNEQPAAVSAAIINYIARLP
ncbi:MAG: alpha/beta hydrolase, partial [Actinomycetota bacterium]